MKKYIASRPEALVIGAALQAYHEAIALDNFKNILISYGLETIDPETWYPQQLTLDIQKAIKESPGGGSALVSIGMKIIDTAVFPPMNSLEEAVNAFATSYPMNFQHQAEDDLTYAEQVGERHIRVFNGSPHSDEMIYGYIYSLVRRFAPEDSSPTVKFTDLSTMDGEGDTQFDVTW